MADPIRLAKRLIRNIKNLFHPIRWGKRYFTSKTRSTARKVVTGFIMSYLALLLPVNYIMTAATTAVKATDPAAIVSDWVDKGLANFATLGIAAPTFDSIDASLEKVAADLGFPAIGEAMDGVSGFFGNVSLPEFDASSTEAGTTEEGWTPWDESRWPEYYRVDGPAVYDYSVKAGEIDYGGLDSLGRTTRVVGCITYDMVEASKGWREDFESGSDPSGWGHNDRATVVLPTGKTYNGWFWNRSHLIADSLGGKAARENLITGTRMQNVGANNGKGGMAYCETKARDFLEANPDCVLYYSATPIYHGDELVPRSVIVDMKSCDGTIDERVEVFNAAKGYEIDYMTGEFYAK